MNQTKSVMQTCFQETLAVAACTISLINREPFLTKVVGSVNFSFRSNAATFIWDSLSLISFDSRTVQ